MATKKPAPKKVAQPAKKAAPTKKAAPAKKAAPVKKAAPAKKPVKPAPKPVAKKTMPVKKAAPAKPLATAVAKSIAKPTPKAAAKPAAAKPVVKAPVPAPKVAAKPVPKAAPVVVASKKVEEKPLKPAKPVKPPKPPKVPKEKPVKAKKPPLRKGAMRFPPKVAVKISGIEKATTVIPLKQLPQRKKEEPIKEVKAPKTTVKTSVAYTPGYTSLDKRTDIVKPNEPLVRYGDVELNEFRDLINKKLDTAKKELAYLQGLITRKDEMGGDNEDGRYMTMEDGSLSMEREQLSQMASRQITYIDHLEKAIMRIESKTYGVCRVTGKLIDKARLRAVPHATLSLEAKLGLVKSGND